MKPLASLLPLVVFGVLATADAQTIAAPLPQVNSSARDIPVAYDVDVVVLGGSTGAVSAAVSAAQAGAKVFLATPWAYLGDDMTATLRLWLEKGEKPAAPLARQVYADPVKPAGGPDPNRLPFSYTADQPSAKAHKDTTPPRLLTDGVWQDATRHSVQYDGNVNLIADLGEAQEVTEVRLMAFQREQGKPLPAAKGAKSLVLSGFKVSRVTVSTSDDKKAWKQQAEVKNTGAEETVVLSSPLQGKTRYLKLAIEKADDVSRVLLGEIEIIGERKKAAPLTTATPMPRPMHVKKVLDDALLAAKVQYLYSCFVTDVLRDSAGSPCGIVMANRAGRQAVLAKVIIDATDCAWATRIAGARFHPAGVGPQTVSRVVVGGAVQSGKDVTARVVPPPFQGAYPNRAKTSSGIFQVIEYTWKTPLPLDGWAAWSRVGQAFRTLTYHPEQQFTADALFQLPADAIVSEGWGKRSGTTASDALPALETCQPEGLARWFVLGACADLSRQDAQRLTRPIALIDLGTRVGQAAYAAAKKAPAPVEPRLRGVPTARPAARGDVRETLTGVRPIQKLPTVHEDARALPVLAKYDVVVVGGGTGGAPAGIGAARHKAKTLVLEYLHGLGGVGTIGAISSYYWGNRVGFSDTVPGGNSWVIEQKMEWWRRSLLDAGADVWYGVIGCGAFVENDVVRGVVVATPQGRGVVLARVVIDSTGNADIAAAAGAQTSYTDEKELAMQGTGLPGRQLGGSYANTDFTITDETDMLDVWHVFVYAKTKYAEAFDQGQLIDTRERRRIVGDFTMTILDQVNNRTFPDTICLARSNFDTHGYTIDPYLELEHPDKKGFFVSIPYRCLLPKGLEGILVTGLGVSAHRDAIPLIRMQADVQNQGYAAGAAAAMAVRLGVPLRKIDLRALQQHLVQIGNLPQRVLSDTDSYPLPDATIAKAVASVKDEFHGAAVLLANPDRALPLLRKAYEDATEKDKLAYAQVLAVLGDATGLPVLMAQVSRTKEWDAGWDYRGMGQFGNALSHLDVLVVALGRTRDRRAVPVILEKLKLLTPESAFSHHRAVGLALELIGDPSAARDLAGVLTQPGMTGHVHDSVEEARRRDQEAPGGTNEVKTRRDSIRELALARALFRCGDYGDVGKQTLTAYTKDLRGHLARHAQAVLSKASKEDKKN